MTNSEHVRMQRDGAVMTVTIDRPKALNALNAAVLDALHAVFTDIQNDRELAVVVLTGAGGKAFVAGADIAEMVDLTPEGAHAFALKGHAVCALISRVGIPVIAAVDGFALGGGLELALACDFIVASDKSRFGQPETKLGLIPGFGGCVRLPRRIGKAAAAQWIYSSDIIDANTALRMGLVTEVISSEQFSSRVNAIAQAIASRGPCAVRAAKRVLVESEDLDMISACALEAKAFSSLFATPEMREGTTAFLAKREPVFCWGGSRTAL